MRALYIRKPLEAEVGELEAPGLGPGQVLLRVRFVGMCGSDLSSYRGKNPLVSYPRIPGHEIAATIESVGEGVPDKFQPGLAVTLSPYTACGKCASCHRGRPNACKNNQTLGVHCDGGLRPLFTVPAEKLHPSPRLSDSQNALVETLAIGCHAIDRSRATAGETVLVIGAGPIGLSAIEFAKLSGARVIVMDMVRSRLDFVRDRMGVADTVVAQGIATDEGVIATLTDGRMADAVIDATGSAASMSSSLALCSFGGRLVYVGITQGEITFPHAPLVHCRELSILASRNALPKDFSRIIGLIESGKIDTQPWITHHAAFADTIRVFPSLLEPASGVIKAVVDMP